MRAVALFLALLVAACGGRDQAKDAAACNTLVGAVQVGEFCNEGIAGAVEYFMDSDGLTPGDIFLLMATTEGYHRAKRIDAEIEDSDKKAIQDVEMGADPKYWRERAERDRDWKREEAPRLVAIHEAIVADLKANSILNVRSTLRKEGRRVVTESLRKKK